MATNTSHIASFYDQNPSLEQARLKENPIEFAVTWFTIQQTIKSLNPDPETSPSLQIVDLGGGTGVYALPLAQLSHSVSLLDISAAEVDLARTEAANRSIKLSQIVVADTRDIRSAPNLFKPSHYDLTLCFGPFYHLLLASERLTLLQDLIVVTKPGGYILAAFVTIFAHLRDVAKKDPGRLTRESEFYSAYLQTGEYTRGTVPMHHTHEDEIRALFAQVEDKVVVERVVGTESFLAGRMDSGLKDLSEAQFAPWAELAVRHAEMPGVAGSADHILVVARKR